MTASAANPMDAVAVLMKERQRIEEWIAQLEGRRAITPPHVFERVRGDYDARLREVTQKLSGRTSEVQATAAALTERLARLQIEETAIRDQRYEAELRSHVGEITAAQWSTIEKESDDRIARIGSERTTITLEIARLQQLLAMTAGRPSGETGMEPRRDSSPNGASRPASFDELEFLKSVTDGARSGVFPKFPAGEAPRSSKPVEPPRSSKGVPRAPTPPAGGAVPESNGTAPRASAPVQQPSAVPAASIADTVAPRTSGSASKPAAPASSENAAPAEKTPDPVPAFLRDVPQEAAKTLRCHACGTMNLPSEWYCERCGGELAAM